AQFNNVSTKINIDQPLTCNNYDKYRNKVIDLSQKQKISVNYGTTIFVHFTYCSSMRTFPAKFHRLWDKYFGESPINEIVPILGTRNVNNLQRRLIHTRT
ncbi:unnamed protein product, partial [Rotaria sp. Silwood2]